VKVGLQTLINDSLYQEYKRRLNVREVLAHYGAENCREMTGPDGTTEIIHSCLLDRVEPHHKNGDRNPSACLTGDTLINIQQGKEDVWTDKRTLSEIYRLWHDGVPCNRREGKGYRKTPQGHWAVCVTHQRKRNHLGTFLTEAEAQDAVKRFRDEHPHGARRFFRDVRVRSWDVDGDMYGRIGHVSDIWEAGVKPLLGITTESGKVLKCTAEHRVFSGRGWVTAGEIRADRDWLYREGRGRDYTKPEKGVPRRLRTEIGLWTQQQRKRLILPVDQCYICGADLPLEELVLDHVIPVVKDISLAFTDSNLLPACKPCHTKKSSGENSICTKPGTKVKALPDRVVKVEALPPEMTYDMEVSDWGNFTANGLVVHNSVNVEKKTFICYNWWGGDLFHLIMKLEGKDSLGDIIPVVGDFLDGATSTSEDFASEIDGILSSEGSYFMDIPEYSTRVLEPWSYSHPYIRERGITLDASSKLQIGYDPDSNRIVFPHFWEGKLVGWQQRAIPGSSLWPATSPQVPKYKNSLGFPKSETLYGAQWVDTSDPVVVVESPMSVAKAHALGFTKVVATFGAKVSGMQIDYLKNFPEVILWFDADSAGDLAARKVGNSLYRHVSLKIVVSEEGKDMGDYNSAEEIMSMIDSAVPAALLLSHWDKEKNGKKKSYL